MVAALIAEAQYPMSLDLSIMGGGGKGEFAPYYIASNNHGKITQSSNMLLDLGVSGGQKLTDRWSYQWGLELVGGYSSGTVYSRYIAALGEWTGNRQHPSRAWVQQLYGRVDYRSLFLQAGVWESKSALLNNRLSSGDFVEGANARPVPQVRAGFDDFQPIPFTNGWVEIQGEISYGKMSDNGWIENHANLWNDHTCIGSLYTYKRCYFRSKSSMPLALTVGMQTAGFFGGTTTVYEKGEVITVMKHKAGVKEFFKMFFPTGGDEDYYLGSALGAWDVMFTYRLPNDRGTVKAYMQKPWETGSGIGFLNGFDGLWGIEYRSPSRSIVDGVVVEYIDFTNQSGPIHYDPADRPGINFPYHTDGGDDYYNNYAYNAYANYGMSLGTPFLKSPLYNRDGFMAYVDNVVRGFHVGIEGSVGERLTYRVLGGYRKGWGAIRIPRINAVHDTSVMVEAAYKPALCNDAMTVTARVGIDRGTMYGNTLGALVTVKYHTDFNIGR
ncbi:MAG: capsule assembly Wzi family protein [Clostridiales bacterium]|nr:capsule assembly Wzi family protein [Clostridiales bacterium]